MSVASTTEKCGDQDWTFFESSETLTRPVFHNNLGIDFSKYSKSKNKAPANATSTEPTSSVKAEVTSFVNVLGIDYARARNGKSNSTHTSTLAAAKETLTTPFVSRLGIDYSKIGSEASTSTKESKKPARAKGVRRAIGVLALFAASVAGSAVAINVGLSQFQSNGSTGASAKSPERQVTPTTAAVSETAIPTPTTRAYVPYQTSPIDSALSENGELIPPAFTVSMPTICINDLKVYEIDKSRVGQIGTARNATPADVMVPDATPESVNCPQIEAYTSAHSEYIGRATRIRDENDFVNGQQVPSAYYQPTAVHLNDNMYPGEQGDFIFESHASTKNAALADTSALKPGDPMIITRDDGYIATYAYVRQDVIHDVPADDDHTPEAEARREEITKQIWDYNDPSDPNAATASDVRCGDDLGVPGSDRARVVDRWVLVGGHYA